MLMVQATLEWENQEDGFLAKILVGDGSKDIPVGTPVAVITEDKGDVSILCLPARRCQGNLSTHDMIAMISTSDQSLLAGQTLYQFLSLSILVM